MFAFRINNNIGGNRYQLLFCVIACVIHKAIVANDVGEIKFKWPTIANQAICTASQKSYNRLFTIRLVDYCATLKNQLVSDTMVTETSDCRYG